MKIFKKIADTLKSIHININDNFINVGNKSGIYINGKKVKELPKKYKKVFKEMDGMFISMDEMFKKMDRMFENL